MEQITIYQVLCYFVIYSVLGWAVEVVYQAVNKGIIINRGFLCGPLCPIYGFGVLSMILLLQLICREHPEAFNAVGIFVIGALITTAIELFGALILDKAFHARWWDYSDCRFNLNGYICPKFSLLWGGGILIVVRVVHPFVKGIITVHRETFFGWIVIVTVYASIIADLIVSLMMVNGLNKRFAELDVISSRMRALSDRASAKIGENALEGVEKAEALKLDMAIARAAIGDELDEKQEEFSDMLAESKRRNEQRRQEILNAVRAHRLMGLGRVLFGNPTYCHKKYEKYVNEIRSEKNQK